MAGFDYPYKKSVNITAWVLQIIVCLILLGASAWVLAVVDGYDLDSLYAYVRPLERERNGRSQSQSPGARMVTSGN